jgi:hypothetical protein
MAEYTASISSPPKRLNRDKWGLRMWISNGGRLLDGGLVVLKSGLFFVSAPAAINADVDELAGDDVVVVDTVTTWPCCCCGCCLVVVVVVVVVVAPLAATESSW